MKEAYTTSGLLIQHPIHYQPEATCYKTSVFWRLNLRVFGNSRGKTNVLIWALRPIAQSTRRPE